METVAIVGVGLIGASFARALRERVGFQGRILGVSRPEFAREALAGGVIDDAVELPDAARYADLIYLSSSISKIIRSLAGLGPLLRPGTLVTDAGSTKAEIMAAANRTITSGLFVGGHPMAGSESRGARSARADLFANRTYFVCYNRPADAEHPRVALFREWLTRIGARVRTVDPADHDRLVAITSHLPQLASTALAAVVDASVGAELGCAAAGSGLRDMTRLAMSGYEGLWSDILSTNRAAIDSALGNYIAELTEIRRSLAVDQAARFERAGAFARKLRE